MAGGEMEGVDSLSFPFEDRKAALWTASCDHAGAGEGGPEAIMAALHEWFNDYFSGRSPSASPPISLAQHSPFTRLVLEETAKVPWGTYATYAEIARRVGRPAGARAVGQALGRNQAPLIIPCHRILAANGAIGGFGGGLCWKRRLLKLEGIEFAEPACEDSRWPSTARSLSLRERVGVK
ncbi:MAG TPA: methylated-DNA--[protein]-cysteine S-methyltransferase [Armatimonadota bacterium]|nr:methylated-DNA--[protein]-cysteine S-methyltransferase [Armatimonadota bacterium]